MEGYQALQASQIGRIFRLMDPKRDIIFVAPKLLHEDILDYYAKIMQFRGVKNPPGRFQVVVPENVGLMPHLSLTQALLCSPKALKRIGKLVSNRMAYIVPEGVTHSELKLCSKLNLPLLGAGPRNLALLASKSNGKKLTTLAELPCGPWATDIYDEDEFYASFTSLVLKHPQVRMWLFKIDDERDARGHAYVDLAQMRAVSEALRPAARTAGQSPSSSTSSPPQVDSGEVRGLLQKHLPKRVVLSNRRVYADFGAWMEEACRVGAVIQAVPDNIFSQTSVHIQIDPDGATNVLGTSEACMSQPFVRAASWYPHTRGSWEVLHEVGMRMGRVLAAKGLVGFASADVVFFDNAAFDPATLAQADREPTPAVIGSDTPIDPEHQMFGELRSPSPEMMSIASRSESRIGDGSPVGRMASPPSLPESRQADYELAAQLKDMEPSRRPATDPVSMMLGRHPNGLASPLSKYACWVVDVDARLTDDAAALFPLQFVAQARIDPLTGFLRLTAEAPAADKKSEDSAQRSEEESQEKSLRWALVTHTSYAPSLEKMTYQTLFQAAKMRGISFDLFNNIGCIFSYLDVFHSLFSLLTVDKSAEACAKRVAGAMSALTEGPPGPRGQTGASRGKVAPPRDAPLPPGREVEAYDGQTITDVQMALRNTLKRWAEKSRHV